MTHLPAISRRTALAVLVALGAVACGGGGGRPQALPTTPASGPGTEATAPPAPALFPLTGLPVGDAATAGRAALSIKIDDAPAARPQAGLDHADVVYEEVVEGGLTRFMAVFQSQDASAIGPVRSVRPVDALLASPLGGYFSYSGGAEPFVAVMRQAPVTLAGYDELPPVFTRRRDRKSPHQFFVSSADIYERGGAASGPPPPLFAFRGQGEPVGAAGAVPAGEASARLNDVTSLSWAWDAGSGQWARTAGGRAQVLEGGKPVATENVVLMSVTYRDTGYRDSAGNVVQEGLVEGEGEVTVLTGGAAVRGRWSKTGPDAVISYTDGSGAPVRLAPGRTWVTLVPTTGSISVR